DAAGRFGAGGLRRVNDIPVINDDFVGFWITRGLAIIDLNAIPPDAESTDQVPVEPAGLAAHEQRGLPLEVVVDVAVRLHPARSERAAGEGIDAIDNAVVQRLRNAIGRPRPFRHVHPAPDEIGRVFRRAIEWGTLPHFTA